MGESSTHMYSGSDLRIFGPNEAFLRIDDGRCFKRGYLIFIKNSTPKMYYGQIFLLLILWGIFKLAFNKQSWCSQKKAKVSFVSFASKNWIKKMVCESNQFSLRNLYIDFSVLVLFRNALLEHLNFIFFAVLFVFGGNDFGC